MPTAPKKTALERVKALLWDLKLHHWRQFHAICNRYGARFHDLRKAGFQIEGLKVLHHGKAYRLLSRTPQAANKSRRVRVYLSPADAEKLLQGTITAGAKEAVLEGLASFKAHK